MRHGCVGAGGNQLAGPRELPPNIIPRDQGGPIHGGAEGIIDGP